MAKNTFTYNSKINSDNSFKNYSFRRKIFSDVKYTNTTFKNISRYKIPETLKFISDYVFIKLGLGKNCFHIPVNRFFVTYNKNLYKNSRKTFSSISK